MGSIGSAYVNGPQKDYGHALNYYWLLVEYSELIRQGSTTFE